MSGCELPVVINSGSGNQGITVSVPVIEYAKALAVPKERLYRALAVSNLIAIHEKSGIGRLSAYCGAVSAGCAAGCGIAYLQGADYEAIAHTLVNSLAIVSGIICDGAKPSCAAKIASSVEAGIMGYHMYLNGQQFLAGDGIVTKGVENTIRNVSPAGPGRHAGDRQGNCQDHDAGPVREAVVWRSAPPLPVTWMRSPPSKRPVFRRQKRPAGKAWPAVWPSIPIIFGF